MLRESTSFAGIVDLTRGCVRRCLPWWDLWSGRYRWCRWLAEEPDQSLDVLGGGCEEELFSHELQPAQTEPSRPMWLFSSAKSASTFFRCRCAYLNSDVDQRWVLHLKLSQIFAHCSVDIGAVSVICSLEMRLSLHALASTKVPSTDSLSPRTRPTCRHWATIR